VPYYAFYWNFIAFYYLPGTTGWSTSLNGRPVTLWNPRIQTGNANFGVRTNCFGFNITGTTNIPITLEACTNLANGIWTPVLSRTVANGQVYFSDPGWTNYGMRFYRIRNP
jgi:hypothetical protein